MKIRNTKNLSDREYRHLAEFRYRLRKFLRFSEENARRLGLEPQQHQLLVAVKGLPKHLRPTIRTLAERLQIKHHSTVELINRLEKHKLVRRISSTSDRREVLIELTPKGEHFVADLSARNTRELAASGPELSKALRAVIADFTKSGRARPPQTSAN